MREWLVLVLAALAPTTAAQEPGWKLAHSSIELSDLIDACGAILGFAIEYQPSEVSGAVAVRIERGMSPEEVWQVAQRALVSRGLISVQPPGSDALQIVPLANAASVARLEDASLAGARAGFVKVLVPLERFKPEELSPAITLLLSKSGTLTHAREGFLVSDLLPHVRQAVTAIEALDSELAPQAIVELPLQHASPLALVALLDRIGQASKLNGAVLPKGTLLASPDRRAILVVAAAADQAFWQARIAQFDQPSQTRTVAYSPRRFGVEETAKLLEASVEHQDLPWRVVLDELTGSIVLSTTPELHAQARDLIDRLEGQQLGPRRSVRAFELKHRSVASVAQLVEDLVQRGALASMPGPSEVAGKDSAAVVTPGPRPPNEPATDLQITLDERANRLVAIGEGRLLDQLGVLIDSLDVASPQVLVETLVVNLSDTKTRALGVELRAIAQRGSNLYELSSHFGLGAPDPSNTTFPSPTAAGVSGVVLDPGDFSALVRALETINDGRVVTIPSVLVANNEQAELGSTLQTPYVSTNASNTVATTSFGGSLDAGTTISVKPQIAAGDKLVLDYSVSISAFVGQASSPQVPPPRQENRIRSVATVPDGSTVVIGGLEVESDVRTLSRVPLLGSLPGLGRLFQSDSTTRQRSRFFVFLRCTVLRNDHLSDLRYVSQVPLAAAGLDDGWPRVEPRVIR